MACYANTGQISYIRLHESSGSREHVHTMHARGHHLSNALGDDNHSEWVRAVLGAPRSLMPAMIQRPRVGPLQRRTQETRKVATVHELSRETRAKRSFPSPPTRSLSSYTLITPSHYHTITPIDNDRGSNSITNIETLHPHRLLQFFLGCPPSFQEGRRFTRKDLVSRRTRFRQRTL